MTYQPIALSPVPLARRQRKFPRRPRPGASATALTMSRRAAVLLSGAPADV